jgi:hypothetical protein
MEIDEVKRRKQQLEAEVWNLICDFERATGCSVGDVYLTKSTWANDNSTRVDQVRVEVRLL